MSATAFTKQFFKVRQIARAAGVDAKTVRRRARLGNWPVKRRGNRVTYRVPLHSMKLPISQERRIADQPETIKALKRAAAVLGFILEMERDPKCGIERALTLTVSRFKHLMPFQTRALRRWIASVEANGIGTLADGRRGRSGRHARTLHKILK